MIIKCGVDLVYLPRFKTSLKRGGENFLRRVFHDEEVSRVSRVPRVSQGETFETPRGTRDTRTTRDTFIEHLAGIFAAKEAVIKALSLPTDSWHDIHISYQSNGVPNVNIPYSIFHIPYLSSLSISHDGNYVIAQFVAILKE